MNMKPILDACCGGKMFYFDKSDDRVLFQDIRKIKTTLCDGRTFEVNPDVQCDFTNMPYEDETFSMVVFDPPHLVYSRGKKSKMVDKNSLQQMYEFVKPPALECCGTPPDGKAKRRERRKLERIKRKNKRL